jgi:hypothetical protein
MIIKKHHLTEKGMGTPKTMSNRRKRLVYKRVWAYIPAGILLLVLIFFLFNGNVLAQNQLQIGSNFSFQSHNFPDRSIRHKFFLAEIAEIVSNLDKKDATFRLVPGLASDDDVSFESINYPGYYLRHQNFRIKLQRLSDDANPDLFQRDATFRIVDGLADHSGISLEAFNYPGYYIRHSNFHLHLHQSDNTALFRQDATFKTKEPFWSTKWTFMVYLNSDNNLEYFGLEDFLEMADVGSSADLNIVVQMDRIAGHTSDYGNWTNTRRFLIAKGDKPNIVPVEQLGEQNMGAEAVLQDFVEWAVAHYEAEHYAVVIWDHGDGWRIIRQRLLEKSNNKKLPGFKPASAKVVSNDTTSRDALFMREVQDALEGAVDNLKPRFGQSFRLDIVGFDACLMAMVEVAYAIRNVADIMVGSQYCEPGQGWPYDMILGALAERPQMAADELSGVIVEKYHESYGGDDSNHYITQSAMDIAKLDSVVENIDRFTNIASRRWARLRQARASAREYHSLNGCCGGLPTCWGVDIAGFAGLVRTRVSNISPIFFAATDLREAIFQFVIHERHSNNINGSNGVAIYFPRTLQLFNNDPQSDGYNQNNNIMPVDFVTDHNWDEWLQQFYDNENEMDYVCGRDSDCRRNQKCCEPWPSSRGICIKSGMLCP